MKKLIMDKNVHLISKTGEKIVVPHKDYNDSEMLKDGKYDDYGSMNGYVYTVGAGNGITAK